MVIFIRSLLLNEFHLNLISSFHWSWLWREWSVSWELWSVRREISFLMRAYAALWWRWLFNETLNQAVFVLYHTSVVVAQAAVWTSTHASAAASERILFWRAHVLRLECFHIVFDRLFIRLMQVARFIVLWCWWMLALTHRNPLLEDWSWSIALIFAVFELPGALHETPCNLRFDLLSSRGWLGPILGIFRCVFCLLSIFCLFIIIWIWQDWSVQAYWLGQEALVQAGWHDWWKVGVETANDLGLCYVVGNGERWLDIPGFACLSLLLALGSLCSSALGTERTCNYRTRLLGVKSLCSYDLPHVCPSDRFGLLALWTPGSWLWFGFWLAGVEHGYTWLHLWAISASPGSLTSKAWLT